MGTILPIVTCILKFSAENFKIWSRAKAEVKTLGNLVDAFPFLDLANYKFLSALSWHTTYGLHVFEYYIRYASFAFLLLALTFIFSGKFHEWVDRFDEWANRSSHSNVRQLFKTAVLLMFFAYITKIPMAFFWPGVSGWTYLKKQSGIISEADTLIVPDPNIPSFIKSSINQEARFDEGVNGYLKGKSLFLHFKNGEILPTNLGLTGYTFPRYIFGKEFEEYEKHKDILFTSMKHRLRNPYFLLPSSIAYPRHTIYMDIDYSDYPDADDIIGFSAWDVWVKIDGQNEILPVQANQSLYLRNSN